MGKLLCSFYLIVAALCLASVFVSFSLGHYTLAQWLVFAVGANLLLFYMVRKEDARRQGVKQSIQ